MITDLRGSRVLFVPAEDSWALPRVDARDQHLWQDPGPVVRRFTEQLGIECSVLRQVTDWQDTGGRHDVYALELRSPSWEPPANARWISHGEISSIAFDDQQEKSAVQGWFDWQAGARTPNDVPWYRAGWLDQVFGWLDDRLEHQGITFNGDYEQIRWWNVSAVLRLQTSVGAVYFKAVPEIFSSEGRLLSDLGTRSPELIPRVIARDDERCWWLLADAGGGSLQTTGDVGAWQDSLAAYARLQIDLMAHAGELTASGCPVVTLDTLATEIQWLTGNTRFLTSPKNGLSPEELAEFQSLALDLVSVCGRLGDLGIAPTLEHGDFHARQIIMGQAGPVFIDWTDARIAHPFFSLTSFLREEGFAAQEGEVAIDFEESRAMLQDAYLEQWTRMFPASVVHESYLLADQLDLINSTVTYVRMLGGMEMPSELEMVPPFFARMLIEKNR